MSSLKRALDLFFEDLPNGTKDPQCSVSSWLRRYLRAQTGTPNTVPCGSCGNCCTVGYLVDLGPSDDASLAPGTGILARHADGSCVYHTRQGCSVHPRRPAACRAWDCRSLAFAGRLGTKPLINKAIEEWDLRGAIKSWLDFQTLFALRLAASASNPHGDRGAEEIALRAAFTAKAYMAEAADVLSEMRAVAEATPPKQIQTKS